MADKKTSINNMNGMTQEDDKTCGITDMNCEEQEKPKGASIINMNRMTHDDDKTCGLTNMNCEDEK